MELLREFEGKRILLLQSQFIFFWRLSKDLKDIAESIHKINFNGGDWIFYPFGAVNYRGKPEGIEAFLKDYIRKHRIDTVIMFNDCKQIHSLAKRALSGQVDIYVFEQGYIRPDYITCEKGGVNGFSSIPKDPEFYRGLEIQPLSSINVEKVGRVSLHRFFFALIYFIFFLLLKPFFKSSDFSVPHIGRYAIGLIKGGIMGRYYNVIQRRYVENFVRQKRGKYYFVPLQMSIDSQIKVHSPYSNVYEFIDDVLSSFSKNAPEDTYLVIKQHPFDIGLNKYDHYIKKISSKLGIGERVKYFKTGDINFLISNSIGCVMVNSTCGINTIIHGKPLKIMGNAIYDIEGIVYKGSIHDFWNEAFNFTPDRELTDRFLSYVILTTQINGSFYKRINSNYACGLRFIPGISYLNSVKNQS